MKRSEMIKIIAEELPEGVDMLIILIMLNTIEKAGMLLPWEKES